MNYHPTHFPKRSAAGGDETRPSVLSAARMHTPPAPEGVARRLPSLAVKELSRILALPRITNAEPLSINTPLALPMMPPFASAVLRLMVQLLPWVQSAWLVFCAARAAIAKRILIRADPRTE